MLEGKRVGVVIPAYDEEKLIAATIAGVPEFVDRIYVVDDHSNDATVDRAGETDDPRVEVIAHDRNQGVGAAIVTGYKRARDDGVDDGSHGRRQSDGPARTSRRSVCRSPAATSTTPRRTAFTGQAWQLIPRYRYLGNAVLSLLTKISGYWHVADSQSGYTAISLRYSSCSTSTASTSATGSRTTCSSI